MEDKNGNNVLTTNRKLNFSQFFLMSFAVCTHYYDGQYCRLAW